MALELEVGSENVAPDGTNRIEFNTSSSLPDHSCSRRQF